MENFSQMPQTESSHEEKENAAEKYFSELKKTGTVVSLDFELDFADSIDKNSACSFIGHRKYGVAESLLLCENGVFTLIKLQNNRELDNLLNRFSLEKKVSYQGKQLYAIGQIIYDYNPNIKMSSIRNELEIYKAIGE